MDNKEKKNEQDIINTQVEPHNHRAIIGFDKNGVPKVLVPVSGHTHKHVDENGNEYEHSHEEVFTEDYMKAVAAYRKTFPKKRMCWTRCRSRQSKNDAAYGAAWI